MLIIFKNKVFILNLIVKFFDGWWCKIGVIFFDGMVEWWNVMVEYIEYFEIWIIKKILKYGIYGIF